MTEDRASGLLLDLGDIATPLDRCVAADVGEIPARLLDELAAHDYDQAPVATPDRGVVGTVPIEALRELHATDRPLTPDHPAVETAQFQPLTRLDHVLQVLAQTRAALVASNGSPTGLVTVSDLNKHPVRAVLYGIFADLEIALASLIGRHHPNPNTWLDRLTEDHRVYVLGFWEVTKRAGMDIGPLAGCTLTQLLAVVEADPLIREALGFASRTQAGRVVGSLPKLRNKVMHPVRPLVLRKNDVEAVRETLIRVLELHERVRGAA